MTVRVQTQTGLKAGPRLAALHIKRQLLRRVLNWYLFLFFYMNDFRVGVERFRVQS